MKRIVAIWFTTLMMFTLAPLASARAATIEPYQNDYLKCVVKLSGVIEKGDADTLNAVLEQVAKSGRHKGMSVLEYDLYSHSPSRVTNENAYRVCLDSPGGSFAEALEISVLISEFLGTAIERNATCLSACSIVFMSGAHYTESDAGIVANRVLHAAGELGFHAPSLTVPNNNYTQAEVNKAYKIAVAGIGQLMERSGDIKLQHTLIAQMLQTPPEKNFMIDTVFKAGRWLINVVGAVRPESIDARAISNACNAYYNWEGDRISTNGFGFNPDPVTRWGGNEVKFEREGSVVRAEMEGFGQEGILKCRVSVDTGAGPNDAALYFGDYYGSIRIGEDGIGTELSPVLLYDMRNRLVDLARPDDSKVESVSVDKFAISTIKPRHGRCVVFSGTTNIDDDPCNETSESFTNPDLSERTVATFLWPSGAKTVVVRESNKTTINGSVAEDVWSDKPVESGDCYRNSSSGNTFCFVEVR